ncbi:MAG: cyclic nucleotide-binding domain-containing protein [Polyangiaceae bacterium]|jgi:CRP-like cAMP-binding protein|nr:cyclic nucleotide-binding domain-containing protein [Polyangiaceae bacterium]
MQPEVAGQPAEIGRVQRILALRAFEAWSNLPASRLAVLAEHSEAKFFRKGSYLFREGLPITRMHMVIDGQVELRRHGRLLRRLGSRGTAGGLSMLARDPEGYDGIALEDTTTLEMGLEDTEDIFEDNFDILYSVLRALATDIIQVRRSMGNQAGFRNHFKEAMASLARPMDLVERIFFLQSSMVVAQGRINAIADMARLARELRLDPGESLWRAGDPAQEIVVLARGILGCTSNDGTQTFRFGAGDTIGGLDALAGQPRWYGAVANERVVVLALDMDSVVDVWEDHIELPMELVRRLSMSLLELLERTHRDD